MSKKIKRAPPNNLEVVIRVLTTPGFVLLAIAMTALAFKL